MVDRVVVVVGPEVVADRALLGEVAEREFEALGVSGGLLHARDSAHLRACLAGLAEGNGEAAVVIPGPAPEARELMRSSPGRAVWLDLTRTGPAERLAHIHGRGIGGLAWAIRHAVHRLRHPARRVRYGEHPDQRADLYLPPAAGPAASGSEPSGRDIAVSPAGRELPVVALVHGGYWRSVWGADLMEGLCADLAARGFAAWNLEYRRPDLHGWAATTADVAAGLGALAGAGVPLDLDRVAVVGHSAGAQLALRAAADGVPMALAVSLAGVLDLVEGDQRKLSAGAVADALGGAADKERQVAYREASPLLRLPLGVPQLIVQGSGDDLDLVDFARRYARAGEQAGDDITYLEMSGDHFAVIDPRAPIWKTTALAIAERLRFRPGKP